MRNLKKFLALVLATLMVVSAAATVSAFDDVAEDNQYAAAIDKLVEYGITNGVDESNFAPDNDVERYQMALFMARALKPGETDWSNGMEIFDDVEGYYGAIAFAYTEGIVTGIGNNLFAPHAGIRYQDALIMALRALGYDVDVSGDPYWLAAYTKASEIGLTKNVAVTKGEKTLTRAETAQVIYNMLKAVPADGGATIEQKNFGVKGIDNSTTFVITATANQSFTGASEKVSDADYVTLQALNKDGTFGDGFYARFDTLGFDEDVKADDVIGYSVDLVNYDAKTNKYEKSVPNKAEVYLTTDDNVTVSDDKKKITVDKKVYWLVDEYTNNTIKNEIIVKTDDGKVTTAILDNVSKLYYNKNGDVVAPDGTVLALMQEVKAANGQTLYKLAKDADKDAFLLYTASELLNVKEVADKYNDFTSVDGYADVDKLTGAVQITLFDDDNDETYDRAITSPIYMSVYNNKDDKKVNIDSNATGLTKSTEGVTYTETLTKGEIFYYTYNKQTKVINVLGTVDIDYGTIDKINLTDKAENFTITISGTPYKFAGTNSASFGASLATTNPGELNKADSIDNIIKKPALDFVKWNNFVTAASIGATVAYYAYNGYIVYAESYDVEESFSLIAIKNMLDIDSDGLIADIYVDGKLVEDATISEVINTNTNKTVKFADLSSLMFSSVASKYFNTENNIYKGIKLEDGSYRLGIDLVANNEVSDAATTSIKNKGFGLTEIKFTGENTVVDNNKIEFLDGISVNGDKYSRIRTNDDTVFYFINDAGKLQIVKGSAKDSIINVKTGTEIYVDKLGYAADEKVGNTAGTATRVIVYHYGSVEGFGIASTVYAIAYIPAKFDVAKFQIDTAKGFGLGSNYEGTYYYYSEAAVNMSDGSKVSLYASSPLTAGKAYQIDENGVVITNTRGAITEIDITKSGLFASATVAKSNIVTDDRYVYIKDGPVVYGDSLTAIKGQNMDLDKVDVKTNGDAKNLIADGKSAIIYFLANENYKAIDLKDGIFVAIFDVTANSTGESGDHEKKIANATYSCKGYSETYGAVYAPDAEGNATGIITLYNDSAKVGEEVSTPIVDSWKEAIDKATYNVSIKKLKGDTFDADYKNTDVIANYTDGKLTVTGFTVKGQPYIPVDLEAATYEIAITFSIDAPGGAIPTTVTYVANVK